jgi:hypothetical protein
MRSISFIIMSARSCAASLASHDASTALPVVLPAAAGPREPLLLPRLSLQLPPTPPLLLPLQPPLLLPAPLLL